MRQMYVIENTSMRYKRSRIQMHFKQIIKAEKIKKKKNEICQMTAAVQVNLEGLTC